MSGGGVHAVWNLSVLVLPLQEHLQPATTKEQVAVQQWLPHLWLVELKHITITLWSLTVLSGDMYDSHELRDQNFSHFPYPLSGDDYCTRLKMRERREGKGRHQLHWIKEKVAHEDISGYFLGESRKIMDNASLNSTRIEPFEARAKNPGRQENLSRRSISLSSFRLAIVKKKKFIHPFPVVKEMHAPKSNTYER